MGFKFIYWTPIYGKYFLHSSILEICGKIWKNGRFSGWLQPDCGYTAWAAKTGLGSNRLSHDSAKHKEFLSLISLYFALCTKRDTQREHHL